MSAPLRCPECGAELSQDVPGGLCPVCLLKRGFDSGVGENSASLSPTGGEAGFVPPTPEELAPRFPQFEVLNLAGRGGMGAVYKVRQRSLDRIVALKILPPEVGKEPAFAERFTREARALARLTHQNIVAVYDFGETDGLYYFVMEYVDGADLRQIIKQGDLKPQQALAIVPQICEALQFAHEEGIVHRDVKPENILVDRRGRVKIADFGLAKLLQVRPVGVTLTQSHQVMGTWHYMAPEQIERPLQVDHRADIYSLGVVFYEMLTGRLPVGRFEPPSQRAQVDVRLDEVVLRSLEHEPERRYQHASDVKTEVESITSAPLAERENSPATSERGNQVDATTNGGNSGEEADRSQGGRVHEFFSTATGWIILFAILGVVSCLLRWEQVELRADEKTLVYFARGYEKLAGQLVAGINLLLVVVLIADGLKVRRVSWWRPLLSVLSAVGVLVVMGLDTAGIWRVSTGYPTEYDEGARELAVFAADAIRRSISDRMTATYLPGAFLAVAAAVCLLVTSLGQVVLTAFGSSKTTGELPERDFKARRPFSVTLLALACLLIGLFYLIGGGIGLGLPIPDVENDELPAFVLERPALRQWAEAVDALGEWLEFPLAYVLLGAGIGLLLVRPWGRRLALGWAVVQLALVLALLPVLFGVMGEELYQSSGQAGEGLAKAEGRPGLVPLMFLGMLLGGVLVVALDVLFPILVLVALNRPRIKEAFTAPASKATDAFWQGCIEKHPGPVRVVLLAIYVACLLLFFDVRGSGGPGFSRLHHTVGYPMAWCEFRSEIDAGFRMQIRLWTPAWLIVAAAFAALHGLLRVRPQAIPVSRWERPRTHAALWFVAALIAATFGFPATALSTDPANVALALGYVAIWLTAILFGIVWIYWVPRSTSVAAVSSGDQTVVFHELGQPQTAPQTAAPDASSTDSADSAGPEAHAATTAIDNSSRPASTDWKYVALGTLFVTSLCALIGFTVWRADTSWVLAALFIPWFVVGFVSEDEDTGEGTAVWIASVAFLETLALLAFGVWLSASAWPLLALVPAFFGMGAGLSAAESTQTTETKADQKNDSKGDQADAAPAKAEAQDDSETGCGTVFFVSLLIWLLIFLGVPMFVVGAVSDLNEYLLDAFNLDSRLRRSLLVGMWGVLIALLAGIVYGAVLLYLYCHEVLDSGDGTEQTIDDDGR